MAKDKDDAQDAKKPIRVRAVAVGFYGGRLRAIDEVFTIAEDADLGSWMDVLDDEHRARLKVRIEQFNRGRRVKAAPGTRPTPAVKII